jgi:undecaprenyl-diphosphatase
MPNFIDLLKALFLGIIEGLTEFIPVSSTAHLLISSYLIDFNTIQNNLFEIVIQLGAILAIVVVYYKKIFEVILNLKDKKSQKFITNLILAFLPAAIIGGLFHGLIKAIFFSNFIIALALIIGGVFIIIIERRPTKPSILDVEKITYKKAFYIGLIQTLAMIPGISRSGATIIGGLLLGLNRKTAAEFSFFLAIPTIAAASIFDFYKNFSSLTFGNIEIITTGLIAAFISALLVIKWFIGFVSKNNFTIFALYRIVLGIAILAFMV